MRSLAVLSMRSLATLLMLVAPLTARAAEFVVNSTSVINDATPIDGICDTGNRPDLDPPAPPSGLCTLRAALDQAAATPEVDTITFALEGQVPQLDTAEFNIDTPVTIRGASGGARRVQVGGGVNQGRVRITAPGVVLESFVIGGLGLSVEADGITVRDCFVGVDAGGTERLGRGDVNLSGTRTDLLFADNVIAARVRGQGDENARITLLGNRLGTDAAGLVALNFGAEVELFGADMTLGGPAVAERNVVLGRVSLAGTGARVRNLHLGVDLPGRRALSNNATLVVAGEGALIGGVDPADRNVLVGGVQLTGSGHRVQGNFIGVDRAGTASLGVTTFGIMVQAADVLIGGTEGVTVGGPCTGACNLIAGLRGDYPAGTGLIFQDTPLGATGATVAGNFFGTDVTGTLALPINRDQIRVRGQSDRLTLGGDGAAEANLFGACGRRAIFIDEATAPADGGAHAVRVLGNRFGTDVTGAVALGIGEDAVRDEGGAVSLVLRGNQVSAAAGHGVHLLNTAAVDHLIEGNVIGGSTAAPGLRNARSGVRVDAAGAIVVLEDNAFGFNGAPASSTAAFTSSMGPSAPSATPSWATRGAKDRSPAPSSSATRSSLCPTIPATPTRAPAGSPTSRCSPRSFARATACSCGAASS